MKSRWIDRTVVAFPFKVTLCVNEDQFKKTLKSFGIKNVHEWEFLRNSISDATCHYPINAKGEHACIVCLGPQNGKSSIEMYSLIVHEAVHIFQQFCELIGEDSPSAEIEAYGIQSLSQGLMYEYERQTKTKGETNEQA